MFIQCNTSQGISDIFVRYCRKGKNKLLKKIISLSACAAIALSCFCGCGKKDSSSEESQEFYYGQAYKEVDGKDIYLIYDGRFIEDSEMDALSDYYNSIQKKDTELFKSTQPEQYIKFIESNQSSDISTFLNDQYSQLESELGEGFDFSQIEVTDCGDSKDDAGLNDIKDLLDGIYKDAGMEKSFSDTIKSSKYVTFDISATTSDGETLNLTDETKYIFNCDDGIYIF